MSLPSVELRNGSPFSQGAEPRERPCHLEWWRGSPCARTVASQMPSGGDITISEIETGPQDKYKTEIIHDIATIAMQQEFVTSEADLYMIEDKWVKAVSKEIGFSMGPGARQSRSQPEMHRFLKTICDREMDLKDEWL